VITARAPISVSNAFFIFLPLFKPIYSLTIFTKSYLVYHISTYISIITVHGSDVPAGTLWKKFSPDCGFRMQSGENFFQSWYPPAKKKEPDRKQ